MLFEERLQEYFQKRINFADQPVVVTSLASVSIKSDFTLADATARDTAIAFTMIKARVADST